MAIREWLDLSDTGKLAGMDANTRECLDRLDKSTLAPSPATRYEYTERRAAKVSIDYHVAANKHFYSVQCHLVRQQVGERMIASTVEIL